MMLRREAFVLTIDLGSRSTFLNPQNVVIIFVRLCIHCGCPILEARFSFGNKEEHGRLSATPLRLSGKDSASTHFNRRSTEYAEASQRKHHFVLFFLRKLPDVVEDGL